MPNVVVYVKQRHADSFEDEHAMKVWVREAVDRALSERGSGLPDRDGSSTRGPDPSAMPRSESDEVKPDWKTGKKK